MRIYGCICMHVQCTKYIRTQMMMSTHCVCTHAVDVYMYVYSTYVAINIVSLLGLLLAELHI